MGNRERLEQDNDDLMNIYNVANNLPQYLDTSDADATDSDIIRYKTAYVNGEKITGTLQAVSSLGLANPESIFYNATLNKMQFIKSLDRKMVINGSGENPASIKMFVPNENLANAIELYPNMLANRS